MEALVELVVRGRLRRLEITSVDGHDVHEHPTLSGELEAAGFTRGYRGWTVRSRAGAR
ncbi:MAG: hypothetical protein ACLFRD_09390 [Nitriliruptoraceae bacterium]